MSNESIARTANERLKDRFSEVLATSLMVGVLLHLLVFTLFPTMNRDDLRRVAAEAMPIVPLADIPLPVAPEALRKPALPVATANVDVTATTDVVRFDDFVAPPAPPPDAPVTTRRATTLVPFTVAPMLLDPEGFQRELERVYPRGLRNAGVGGTVELLLHIDEEGVVLEASVGRTSGYEALDEAAVGLADRMRFRPALNGDRAVAVLVSIPVTFRVRDHRRSR